MPAGDTTPRRDFHQPRRLDTLGRHTHKYTTPESIYPMPPTLYTPDELAQRIGCNARTVRRHGQVLGLTLRAGKRAIVYTPRAARQIEESIRSAAALTRRAGPRPRVL